MRRRATYLNLDDYLVAAHSISETATCFPSSFPRHSFNSGDHHAQKTSCSSRDIHRPISPRATQSQLGGGRILFFTYKHSTRSQGVATSSKRPPDENPSQRKSPHVTRLELPPCSSGPEHALLTSYVTNVSPLPKVLCLRTP